MCHIQTYSFAHTQACAVRDFLFFDLTRNSGRVHIVVRAGTDLLGASTTSLLVILYLAAFLGPLSAVGGEGVGPMIYGRRHRRGEETGGVGDNPLSRHLDNVGTL